jgi:hypothetical protein
VRANDCVFTVNAISSYGTFPSSGDAVRINFVPQVSSGSSVHIGPNPPSPVLEGQQWMEVPAGSGDATMWIYDGANWLQQPGGKDGADGADGTNGSDGLWTDNGGGSISYDGAVTVTGDLVASKSDAGADALAVGVNAGMTTQGEKAVGVGFNAGKTNQGDSAVAIGRSAGATLQSAEAVAVGRNAGNNNQGVDAVAVGFSAGDVSQGANSVAVGLDAAHDTQGVNSVAIGNAAGRNRQADGAVSLGCQAGYGDQGANSIAIGYAAGYQDQAANSIVISATGQSSSLSYAGVSIEVPGAYLNYNGSDEWRFEGGNVVGGGLRFDSIVQDGSPVIDAKGLISTLSTLRNATKDETTLEGMRDALADAIGGLIENLEHEIATQEISE